LVPSVAIFRIVPFFEAMFARDPWLSAACCRWFVHIEFLKCFAFFCKIGALLNIFCPVKKCFALNDRPFDARINAELENRPPRFSGEAWANCL